jgi:GxxExxY protein
MADQATSEQAGAEEREPGEEISLPHGLDALTYLIIGASRKVHRTLGPGFTESTYQAALREELVLRRTPFESQREFDVYYEGTLCGRYKPDLVVSGKVVVELKAVAALAKEHRSQALSYLKASGLPLALLLNFGGVSLEVRRLRNG